MKMSAKTMTMTLLVTPTIQAMTKTQTIKTRTMEAPLAQQVEAEMAMNMAINNPRIMRVKNHRLGIAVSKELKHSLTTTVLALGF
jgi:hypothetical protein